MPNKLSEISIILYGLRFSPLPYEEKLKKLHEIGYRSIQGGLQPGMTNKEHRAFIDDMGMEFSCFSGGFEALEEDAGKFIEGCHAFDCDEIMIGTMPTECRFNYDGYMKAIDRMNAIGKTLSKEGIFLGYHNHAQEFRRFKNGKTGMDLLFDHLDPTGVHFLLDTHWVHSGGGDVLQWIEKVKGRIAYLHVKDYRIAPANFETGIGETSKQFAQIGEGNLPWPQIIETAHSVGVKAFIVEQDFPYEDDPMDCAATSFAALKKFGLN